MFNASIDRKKWVCARRLLSSVFLCTLFSFVGESAALSQDSAAGAVAQGSAGVLQGATTPGSAADAVSENNQSIDNEDPTQNGFLRMNLVDSMRYMAALRPSGTRPQDVGSLFFTPWQYALLQESKRGFLARPPDQGEVEDTLQGTPEQKVKGIRELSLSGIVYINAQDWTVWLNGQRLKPDALPPELLDIKVHEGHVELKWFDEWTNLIYPVRLRPHERFNLDTRIFLPGKSAF